MCSKAISLENFHNLLKNSIKNGDLATTRRVQCFIISIGLESNASLAIQFLRTFSVCRSLSEAEQVFQKILDNNIFTWTAMIMAYASLGDCQKAIKLHYQMKGLTMAPDSHSFVAVLKACANGGVQSQGRLIHSHIVEAGLECNVFIGNTLICMYAKGGDMEDSLRLFYRFPNKDTTTWTAVISGFFQCGYVLNALQLFEHMQFEEGIEPNLVTWNAVIAGCMQHGLCEDAYNLFSRMQQEGLQPNKLTWNSLISGYGQQDCGDFSLQIFRQMQIEGIEADKVTFMSVLKACSTISTVDQVRFIQSQIVQMDLGSSEQIGSILIDLYAKCKSVQAAEEIFNKLTCKDSVLWNTIISAHVNEANVEQAFKFFLRMQHECVTLQQSTFVLMLKLCCCRGLLHDGQLLFNYIYDSHCQVNYFIGTALVDLYMKCGAVEDAATIFNKLNRRGVVTWSALIAGYAWHGYATESIQLLQEMQQQGIKPNVITWNGLIRGCAYNELCFEALTSFQKMLLEGFQPNEASLVGLISACSGVKNLIQGEALHSYVVEEGWNDNSNVGIALINMYANFGSLQSSLWNFNTLANLDILEWSAIVEAFSQHGHYQEVIQHFNTMQHEGLVPNHIIVSSILKACVNAAIMMLYQCRIVHVLALELGFGTNLLVGNNLIHLYTKSGSLNDAWRVLDKLPNRDEVTWSSMIEGYVDHSDYKSALKCFESMQRDDFDPNGITFLSLLSACSHAGLVEEASRYFNLMRETYSISLTFNHYSCMADLLGRAGCLMEADDLLQTMPYQPNFLGHLCLLNHCKNYGNSSIGKQYFDMSYNMTCRHSASYDLMSDLYANSGSLDASSTNLKELKRFANAWKKPGGAHVEFDNSVHFFSVGDRSHPQITDILGALKKLSLQLEKEGYVHHLDLNMNEESSHCIQQAC